MRARPRRTLLLTGQEETRILLRQFWSRRPTLGSLERTATLAACRATLEAEAPDACLLELAPDLKLACQQLRQLRDFHRRIPMICLLDAEQMESASVLIDAGACDVLCLQELSASHVEHALRLAQELFQARQQLQEQTDRFQLVQRGSRDGVWEWDLRNNRLHTSHRWRGLVGINGPISDRPDEWFSRVHPEDLDQLRHEIDAHRRGVIDRFETEHRVAGADGEYRWVVSRGQSQKDSTGAVIRLAGSLTDITAEKVYEAQLLRGMLQDELTRLPNRAQFLSLLEHALRRSQRGDHYQFAVLFVDLDRFQLLNQSFGHQVGDQLLMETARRLEKCLRPGDTLARLGGDEFAILLDAVEGPTAVHRFANSIHQALADPIRVAQQECYTSASIGIAASTGQHRRPEDMLRDAHTAMYRAKAQGRCRHELFDAAMHQEAVDRLRLENDLRRAIDREELRVHYQPIVDLATGRITAFEALVRWDHGARGMIYPQQFIPIAEETGLIKPIGKWVLHQACKQLRRWHDRLELAAPISMSVNLSSSQFAEPDLVDDISEIQRQTGMRPRQLRIEITETTVMTNAAVAASVIDRLRDLQIQLHIDDFGAGYSSLSRLPTIPIDTLKIDRSFVHHMTDDPKNAEIVRAIVALGQNLGLHTTAEGVEHLDQLHRLRDLGCTHGQGFFFACPMTAADAEQLLIAQPCW